ncbi:ABC transporter permease [Methanolapillus ohkumae]|uniref:Macrolide export ATP-binding/permease protein MacB n=1 Tax=Methanolapillus ohkumae TaxID=3028298 RepID=A0AA96V6E1_9EURY|nr:Macrolide export ATP-binding/permease protein MacB [Methanosarcinaceae archaeon Am2]
MISLTHCVNMAVHSLRSSKMRSGLTALGIIIGIAAVIATFTLGSSFGAYFSEELDTTGTNYVLISATKNNIFYDQQLNIVSSTPGVTGVSGEIFQTGVITYSGEQKNRSVLGWNENIAEILSLPIYEGNFISNNDLYSAVIGKDVAFEDFRSEIGIRSTIDVTLYNEDTKQYVTETFKVKGILGSNDTNLLTQNQENTFIIIPIETMKLMTGSDDYQTIYAMTDSREELNETDDEITRRLARSLGVSDRDINEDNDEKIPFLTTNQAEILDEVSSLTATLQLFLLGIGGISLVVGAVGIMNIMLVTVTERTKEIGTLKALGYSSRDVLLLFVIESIIISAIGGFIGTVLGLTIAYVGVSYLDLTMAVPFTSVLFGVGLSIVIGVLAGAQPSYKAAKMNPVDALRSD